MGGDWVRSHEPISSLNETETYAVPKVSPILKIKLISETSYII